VGVACARGIAASCGLLPRLKWPNDVMVEGRKLAGILLESRVEDGRLNTVVAGVGVNVATLTAPPREVAERATAIADHVTHPPPRQALLANILEELEDHYTNVSATGFAERVVDEASALSDVLGRDVTVRLAGGGTVEGSARRLTERGELEVNTTDGSVTVHSGEIERLRTA
jgi:BirA family biotin operon repressor/biotin-[acetyl-CoA-carboxylase] ligase